MKKNTVEFYRKVIYNKATELTVILLKSQNKLTFSPYILAGFLALVLIVSYVFSIWWLIFPAYSVYFGTTLFIRYKRVKDARPRVAIDMMTSLLNTNVTVLKDIKEDLLIKTNNNIYNEKDIAEKKKTIKFIETSNELLLELIDKEL